MHSEISIWIDAPPETVFPLVADLARWPERLPHYRYVRVTGVTNGETTAAMSARRGPIPVFWHAAQRADAASRSIRFHHVRGITRGMEVLWTLDPENGGTRARIVHDLALGWPLLGPWFAERVIEAGFIRPIATRTLRRFKDLAEGERHAVEPAGNDTSPGAAGSAP